MPTYNYLCQDCGEKFNLEATLKEKEQGTSDKFKCVKCRSQKIKQQFSAANFIKNVFKSGQPGGGCCGGGCQCG